MDMLCRLSYRGMGKSIGNLSFGEHDVNTISPIFRVFLPRSSRRTPASHGRDEGSRDGIFREREYSDADGAVQD